MTLLFVSIALFFTLFTLYKTIAPFIGSRTGQLRVELLDDELRKIELLVARKAALVQSLRELEYDWQTSKISEEDYTRFKLSYERQAIGIMRRLDAIHGGRAWEQNIDDELARRLQDDGYTDDINTAIPMSADQESSSQPDPTPEQSEPAHELACEKCDKPLLPDDVFCARCGHQLAQDTSYQNDDSSSQPTQSSTKSLRPEIIQ